MDDRSEMVISKEENMEMKGKYLAFYTDGQLFGISIASVVQIVGMQPITEIPDVPHYVKGIINLRGNVIPVIDIRLRFRKEEAEYDERTCIIIAQIQDDMVGFIVDMVDAVTNIDDSEISTPPNLSSGYSDSYVNGIAKVDNRIILLLDVPSILGENVLNAVF